MLTPESMSQNWDILMSRIDAYIKEPRRSQLKEFYKNTISYILLLYHNTNF